MLNSLLLSVLKNKWVWIAWIAFGAGVYVYGVIQDNNELKADNERRAQNSAAYQDSLGKSKDSLQTLAVRVGNLQSESGGWKNKYVAISTKYQIALDTIKVLRRRSDSSRVVGDSVGIVNFSGTKGIASYQGRTEINVRTNESSYSLTLAFSDIETQSTLLYDESDKLWKIRTLALTPGIKLRGLSTIDDETFRKIQGLKEIKSSVPSTFGVGGLIASDRIYGGFVIAPSQWMIGIHYKIFEKYRENESWSDKIMIGVHYFIW